MVTDQGPIKMLSEMGIRLNENTNFSPEDMGFLNRDQELNFIRSGSCPPTVEGSLKANNAFLNDEDFRSDPDYSSYYFGRGNVNPRLPPPNMSKEDWRSVGSSKVGGIGDNRKVGGGNSKLAPGVNLQNLKREEKMEWVDEGDGLIGLSLGRQKSFAEIFQEDLGHSNTIMGKPSRPSSRNAFNDTSETDLALHRELISGDNLRHSSISSSQTFASVLGASLSRNNTPDPILVARTPSPSLPPVGVRMNKSEKENNNSYNSFSSTTPNDLIGGLLGMSLSNNSLNRRVDEDIITQAKLQKDMIENHNFLFEMQQRKNNVIKTSQPTRNSINNSNTYPDLDRSFASLVGSPGANSPSNYYTTTNNYGLGGYSLDPVSPSFGQNFSKFGNHTTIDPLQMPQVDPLYAQYFTNNINEPMAMNNSSYLDLLALQKQYMETLLPSQKQYGMPYMNNSNALNPGYYGNPSLNVGMNYLGSPLTSPVFSGSPGGPGSPLRLDERSMRFQSGVRNLEGIMGSWHSNGNINMSDGFGSSLLDEFKTNKVKNYELSDILGHVVEFSADQYGSRFIQQKLETATTEEKNLVYDEIRPHAYALMTDVFGNYVIQKFFEHGSSAQRRELAEQLIGHVLALSLQMYGCRVIQKAIEVVELDQQTKMVAELDGHVMRCVRDQNGNHVIQKCIECVPQDVIHFIVSTFYGQVVTLSTHPYGCRVIQRVLENCDNSQTQQIMMDEIMPSICMLAQDQYGNYVVQHVLEHGKPEERSSIIKKLAGQIVQMSQQKYASNVVEKCLAFGGPEERQYLVNEILGTTDENEPLQAMMKDQFANYVVQKVLETCDDRQREYILSRIKVHLNALKKYTYGKHIVARVEKLVAAGERRIGLQSN